MTGRLFTIAALAILTACGPSAKRKAEAEKARAQRPCIEHELDWNYSACRHRDQRIEQMGERLVCVCPKRDGDI